MAKTIKIADLVDRTNVFLRDSAESARMERIAVHAFVSDLLLNTSSYAGFGYLKPYGSLGSDDSRTFFYVKGL
jgi:hypothetical protein